MREISELSLGISEERLAYKWDVLYPTLSWMHAVVTKRFYKEQSSVRLLDMAGIEIESGYG